MDAVASDDGVANLGRPSADGDAHAHAATEAPAAGQPHEAASGCARIVAGHTQRHAAYTLIGAHVWPSPGAQCQPYACMHGALRCA